MPGIFAHNLEWAYIFTGIAIGAVLIVVDLVLKKSSGGKRALPVLAVGMGIYLPPSINMPIVIGAVLAAVLKHIISKKAENREGRLKNAERIGTLFSAGLIVGEPSWRRDGIHHRLLRDQRRPDARLRWVWKTGETTASWLGLAFFYHRHGVLSPNALKAGRVKCWV